MPLDNVQCGLSFDAISLMAIMFDVTCSMDNMAPFDSGATLTSMVSMSTCAALAGIQVLSPLNLKNICNPQNHWIPC